MKQQSAPSLPSPLESVRYQFERWRESRKEPREAIPEDLWAAAVGLRNQYPISHISKSLRLNHTDLKNRISATRKKKKTSDPAPSPLFVELDGLKPFGSSEFIVEMEHACGSKMKMTFKGQAGLDLLELAKAFWNKGK
jgi:hypothetical protein